jgi:hypothetical protein
MYVEMADYDIDVIATDLSIGWKALKWVGRLQS